MQNLIFFLLILVCNPNLSSKCSDVPKTIRNAYSVDLYQAFTLQSYGKSTIAMTQFQVAYQAAVNAGESIQRLKLIEQLFIWYRMYGTSLRLFYKNPSGHDHINGEYKKFSSQQPVYQSEWGKTPEQSEVIREFMLGVAEVISGIFCVTVGSTVGINNFGYGVLIGGSYRMLMAINKLTTEHEKAMVELKEWEEKTKKFASAD